MHGVISRSPEVNAEVHALRNQIRTKEFELQRLQQASNAYVSSQPTSAKNTINTSKQISELRDDIKKLQSRLDRLIGSSSGKYDTGDRRRKMNEPVESRDGGGLRRLGTHIPSTPAARSVQSYQSPLLSPSPKTISERQVPDRQMDASIVPLPPQWLHKR